MNKNIGKTETLGKSLFVKNIGEIFQRDMLIAIDKFRGSKTGKFFEIVVKMRMVVKLCAVSNILKRAVIFSFH